MKMYTIKEIPQAYPGVAEHAIRQWVNSEQLPAVRSGRKILIAEQNLEKFLLEGNNNQSAPEPQPGQIRRLL